MEICVNEYVRINKSSRFLGIGKVLKIVSNTIYVKMYLSLPISFSYEEIKGYKHSKYPIDLIEVGDYVNGKLIHKIDKGPNYCYLYYGNCKTFVDYQIKTIVTHEQFSSIEYKVEESK